MVKSALLPETVWSSCADILTTVRVKWNQAWFCKPIWRKLQWQARNSVLLHSRFFVLCLTSPAFSPRSTSILDFPTLFLLSAAFYFPFCWKTNLRMKLLYLWFCTWWLMICSRYFLLIRSAMHLGYDWTESNFCNCRLNECSFIIWRYLLEGLHSALK